MERLAPNQALAIEVVSRLRAAGVRSFCLCPGGRNAPLVEALEAERAAAAADIEVLGFFEERSASFFALGRARRDGRPAAVVTTSGTACAELLPAMVEAHYSCVPLVAVTADRPASYRGTAAPQTIEQPGIFGVYARQSVDLEAAGTPWILSEDGPAHVNVCFDEPLLGGWVKGIALPTGVGGEVQGAECGVRGAESGVRSAQCGVQGGATPTPRAASPGSRPLVLLGALPDPDDQGDALDFCRGIAAPVLAEASSQLKPRLGDLLLRAGEAAVRRGFDKQLFDSVVRVGDVPSCRTWRDLEVAWRVPVVSVSRRPWAGLTHAVHVQAPRGVRLSACLPAIAAVPGDCFGDLLAFDREAAAATECLLADYPSSEPALVRALSRAVPSGSFVYLGNSQPIREWNQFAELADRGLVFGENRGANGIDGQLSTFLGQAGEGRENWAIVGDLTALYDLPSPWALRYTPGRVRIVILNNGGGRIFDRMFANPRFQNRHTLSFEAVAALWGLEYRRDVPAAGWRAPAGIVEVRPDEEQTREFWRALDARAGL